MSHARAWAIRCQLELQQHTAACWVTLTYDEAHVPPTLHLRHLQGWLKRVRSHFAKKRNGRRNIRFFACGEYGERGGRPHYHAIIYGLSEREAWPLAEKWGKGNVRVDPLSPAAIAYVCGYALKKQGSTRRALRLGGRVPFHTALPATAETWLDRSTGEEYRLAITYQPPFVTMSRRPGIGAHARRHARSWRDSAVWGDRQVPVPRYLHDAWANQASPSELIRWQMERRALRPATLGELQEKARHLAATATINAAKVKAQSMRKKL